MIGSNFIVHNYGHGGSGYQSGWASAWEAERLVLSILEEKRSERTKAKL